MCDPPTPKEVKQVGKSKDISKDGRVKKEINRLRKILKNIPAESLTMAEGLIVQAARLRIMLDDMWIDIRDNGDTEKFSQSKDIEAYERERPVARLYNTRDKNYQSVVKQLCDLAPAAKPGEEDPLMGFIGGGGGKR